MSRTPQPDANEHQLLLGVLDSSLDGIMAFSALRDADGRVIDFVFNLINTAAEQIVDRSAESLQGKRLLDVFPGNKADGLFDAYVEVVETGKPFVTEHHYAHDGLDHWFRISATRCGDGFAVTFSDITQRKAGEERFRVLFECSTDAHLLFDETGIIDCNQAAIEMLGYNEKAELLNVHPAELSPEFQPDGRRSLEKCVEMDQTARERGYHRFDWIHLRKDGQEIPVEVTLNPVKLSGRDTLLVVWHDLTERFENEQKLRETATRLSNAQELAKLGSWEWTTADNQIVWSDQIKRMFGVPLDQAAPSLEEHRKQIHPDDVDRWEAVLKKTASDHRPYTMRFRSLLSNGESRMLESRGQCEVDEDGKLVRTFGTVQDITEKHEAEQELHKLSMVASRTEDGVVLADAQGRVEWVNRAFTEITGYTLEELRGKVPGRMLQGPETDREVVARIRERLQRGEGFREQLLNYRKTGEKYWIEIEVRPMHDADGAITHFMAIERDITARIEQQQALDDNQHRLEFALEVSRTGMWDWDLTQNTVFFSETWYTMLGYEPGELPMEFETWESLAHPDDLPRIMAAVKDYLSGRIQRYVCEMRMRARSGEWQWVKTIGEAAERGADGAVTRMIGLHLDIHRQKQDHAELEAARDEARQASTAKSAFVANMSHEIRTPMNAILGYADLMLDADQTEADKRNHAQTIRRNGRHLLNILNDVLDISKIEAGKMTIERVGCAPDQLFADVITLMMPKALERGIDLDFEAVDPLPQRVVTDPTRVRQVLLNLVGNAIKFTRAGSVRVVVHYRPEDEDTALIRCEVIDTGVGIAPEAQARLFKPFSQADDSTTREFGGSGLGLAISHTLCSLLSGDLTCVSAPGEGSTFTATFKVGLAEPADVRKPVTKPVALQNAEPLAGRRVLVVEDGPDNRRLIRHYLVKAGAEVEVAENGALGRDAALEAFGAGEPFDAVLMDMQMPVLDGYGATRELRNNGYDQPIIALTAHASSDDRERCLAAGCDAYLSKPVDRHQLARTVAGQIALFAMGGAHI